MTHAKQRYILKDRLTMLPKWKRRQQGSLRTKRTGLCSLLCVPQVGVRSTTLQKPTQLDILHGRSTELRRLVTLTPDVYLKNSTKATEFPSLSASWHFHLEFEHTSAKSVKSDQWTRHQQSSLVPFTKGPVDHPLF